MALLIIHGVQLFTPVRVNYTRGSDGTWFSFGLRLFFAHYWSIVQHYTLYVPAGICPLFMPHLCGRTDFGLQPELRWKIQPYLIINAAFYFPITQHDFFAWREGDLRELQRGNICSSKATKRQAGGFKASRKLERRGHRLLFGGVQTRGRVQGVLVTSATPDTHLSPGYSWLESWGFTGQEPVWNPLKPPQYFITL